MSGMPLLSGPPPGPDANENACRRCNKEFNIVFARSRKCNHCGELTTLLASPSTLLTYRMRSSLTGHMYCQSCTDYHALMPRQGDGNTGYDPVAVCAFCSENLTSRWHRPVASRAHALRGMNLTSASI